jgi:hypothetical protein
MMIDYLAYVLILQRARQHLESAWHAPAHALVAAHANRLTHRVYRPREIALPIRQLAQIDELGGHAELAPNLSCTGQTSFEVAPRSSKIALFSGQNTEPVERARRPMQVSFCSPTTALSNPGTPRKPPTTTIRGLCQLSCLLERASARPPRRSEHPPGASAQESGSCAVRSVWGRRQLDQSRRKCMPMIV